MDNQEIQPRNATSTPNSSATFDEKNFKPKGAIAFFALLVVLGMIIWFGIYFLMLSRI